MEPMTTSLPFPKSVPAICRRHDAWDDLEIAGHCFWLGLLYTGEAYFEVNGQTVKAVAPCFLCFDDLHTPRVLYQHEVHCDSIYFEPTFLNINMTSARVHDADYARIAAEYDLFLLAPFTDGERFAFPLLAECLGKVRQMFVGIEQEFTQPTDWFWSCRSRSYFTELIFLLEAAYHYALRMEDTCYEVSSKNIYLQKAIIYIGSHFAEDVSLADIVEAAGINHTTLTYLFHDELGMTPMSYLWHHRIQVAKKQLELTALPIKDISARCGFKTVQHFTRKFQTATGETPALFRENRLRARRMHFQQGNLCGAP